MEAKVKTETSLPLDEIMIGNRSLYDILQEIHDKTSSVVLELSIQNQSDTPDYEDIDAPLHGVLNLIEKLEIY